MASVTSSPSSETRPSSSVKRSAANQVAESGPVVEAGIRAQRRQGDAAIHRPGVEVGEPERAGDRPGNRRFARARRAVDGDDHAGEDRVEAMRSWDISTLDVQPHSPAVLDSEVEGRAIVIHLPAGEQLGEHQVYERAWLLVVSGAIEIDGPGGDSASGGPGLLAEFDPNERREVRATEDARLLLILSPWPGEGHPSQR